MCSFIWLFLLNSIPHSLPSPFISSNRVLRLGLCCAFKVNLRRLKLASAPKLPHMYTLFLKKGPSLVFAGTGIFMWALYNFLGVTSMERSQTFKKGYFLGLICKH